jgi:hypothetical protein
MCIAHDVRKVKVKFEEYTKLLVSIEFKQLIFRGVHKPTQGIERHFLLPVSLNYFDSLILIYLS